MTEYTRRSVAGIARKSPGGRKAARLSEAIVAAVITRLRAGEYRCDVARSCGVSEYSITMIAKKHGITYAQCPRGTRWGQHNKAAVVVEAAQKPINWRAVAAGLRWGGRGSHHYD